MSSGGVLVRLNFSTRLSLAAANLTSVEFLLYDPIKGEFIASPYTALIGGRAQRLVTTSPIFVQPSDQILNCNIPTPTTCQLPPAASRNGSPLTFKDLGQATANHITLNLFGTEAADGANTPIVIDNNYQWITLVPFNDGFSSGWSIQ